MSEFINEVNFDFIFTKVNYKVKIPQMSPDDPSEKYILKNINGLFRSGEISAIMGPSGSGKTSLLNFLTDRIEFPGDSEHSGKLFINSKEIDKDSLSKLSSYVMQDDLMFEIFTPRETLAFAAKLRYSISNEEIDNKINTLIEDLKLTKCADTLVGNDEKKGISGGEKKRVSIGVEILSNPHILFLDEPTSGLDSRTSFIIIEFLKEIAKKFNKAIIFTIHQPSSNIVMLFHRLVLLNKGELVYQGENPKVIEYFSSIGYDLGDKANPADAFMHKIEILNNEKNPILMTQYSKMLEKDINSEIEEKIKSTSSGDLSKKNMENSGLWIAFNLLFMRAALNIFRNPVMLRMRILMVIIFTFITCSIFSFLKQDAIGANNRSGFFFFFCINNFMQNLFAVITTFPVERSIFLREHASNLYGVFPYFLGKSLVETPVGLFFNIIYSLIVYYIVGLRSNAQYYFTFVCIYACLVFVAQGMGLCFGCAFSNFSTAMVVTQFSVMPIFLFSGFLINQANMPVWLAWLRFLSPFKYTIEAALRNEFDGVDLSVYGGFDPVQQLNLTIGMWNCVYILIGMGLGFRILACFLLKLLVRKTG